MKKKKAARENSVSLPWEAATSREERAPAPPTNSCDLRSGPKGIQAQKVTNSEKLRALNTLDNQCIIYWLLQLMSAKK